MGGQSGGQQRGQVLVEQQPHAARGEKVRRSRSAAKAKQARMSSWVSAGNSARSSDSGVPAARYPRTSYTVMRVSRMHGFPFRRPGLMVIRSSKFTPERCPRWARMTRRRWVAEAENWKTGESGNWETGTNKACASCVSWRQIRMAAKRRRRRRISLGLWGRETSGRTSLNKRPGRVGQGRSLGKAGDPKEAGRNLHRR